MLTILLIHSVFRTIFLIQLLDRKGKFLSVLHNDSVHSPIRFSFTVLYLHEIKLKLRLHRQRKQVYFSNQVIVGSHASFLKGRKKLF